jgi:hypothetical protein
MQTNERQVIIMCYIPEDRSFHNHHLHLLYTVLGMCPVAVMSPDIFRFSFTANLAYPMWNFPPQKNPSEALNVPFMPSSLLNSTA